MAPPKGIGSPAQPAGAGATGEWKVVQRKRTARQAQQSQKSVLAGAVAAPVQRPQKSARTGGAIASGFARLGPRACRTLKTVEFQFP
eukprot:5689828-Alexandrium_andersonii.AAC.1